MKRLMTAAAVLLLLLGASVAQACYLNGHILCDGTGTALPGITVQVTSTDGAGFTGTATPDPWGYYIIILPEVPGCYRASLVLGAGESVVSPAGGFFDFCSTGTEGFTQDWLVESPTCGNVTGACWLTGGGAKFSSLTGTYLGQSGRTKLGKEYNWGGNVNPGCSPTAGEGGQWNTIDALQKLHFQGFAIEVVRCGNIDDYPPGSESPVTPFNFIEFQGTGRVQGIQGNKADYPLVYFFARAEDRNEPGSTGMRDGAGKDRYFLNVYTNQADPVGSSLILVDIDDDPATVDPLIITDGNMQIHISGCETPMALQPAVASSIAIAGDERPGVVLPTAVEFAAPRPNPSTSYASLQFALPREATVSLGIFDVAGRLVRDLAAGVSNAGPHSVTWNLLDRNGQPVSNGVFFARLVVDGKVLSRPVCVAR